MGYKPSWYPEGDPLGGMAVAHDILEHFPNDDGKAEGEFMALGASLWIRGQSGYFRNGTPESNIASDFPEIWRHVIYEDERTYVRECPHKSRNEEVQESGKQILIHALEEMREQFEEYELPSEETQQRIVQWLAYGFNRAAKRYGKYHRRGITHYEIAHQLFAEIEKQADEKLKYAEEGQILTVFVNYKQLEVRTDLDYPAESYY